MMRPEIINRVIAGMVGVMTIAMLDVAYVANSMYRDYLGMKEDAAHARLLAEHERLNAWAKCKVTSKC